MVYLIFIPFFAYPFWCGKAGLTQYNCLPDIYPQSSIPYLGDMGVTIANLVAFSIILVAVILRVKVKKQTKWSSKIRTFVLVVLNLQMIAENISFAVGSNQGFYTIKVVRPLIVTIYIR
mmetsp:Transcript_24351/g.18522  ORF Transcript_24351/g.18522 Transcript_24351/m.18522 type:complete len:119 (-) Transcript_24351:657-1013(-)